jgi:anaerobic ribonucleoside-triphosphate reductase activating protein
MAAEGARRSRRLRLHAFIPHSRANGPGCRAVVWVQGCTLGCPGCFNPETHDFHGGQWVGVDELFERIRALQGTIEGITVSGGEPFQQRPALLALLQRVRAETDLSVLVFTGYTWDEIQRFRETAALLSCIDVLIAGRYDARLRSGARPARLGEQDRPPADAPLRAARPAAHARQRGDHRARRHRADQRD